MVSRSASIEEVLSACEDTPPPARPLRVYTPTRFIPTIKSGLIEQDIAEGLPHYEKILTACGITKACSFIPPWWQIDALAFTSHDRYMVPHATLTLHQYDAAVEFMRRFAPQMLLTTPDVALELAARCMALHLPLPLYAHILEPWDTPQPTLLPGISVTRERMIAPGVTLFYQCLHLANNKDTYHVAEPLHKEEDALYIERTLNNTSYKVTLPPLTILDTTCPCGDTSLVRISP